MKLLVFSVLLFSSLSFACPNLSGKYGNNSFHEKIEQKSCDEITISWVSNGQEIMNITKKLDGKLSSNAPYAKNEYTSMKFEADHLYYIVMTSTESGFSEGRDYKLSNGDIKRMTRWYRSDGTVEDFEDVLHLMP